MSYQISGEFAVDSREKNGTFFTNDLERAVSLIFTAFGTWNTGSESKNNYGPEGKIGARNKKTPYPDSTLYALLAVNSKNEVVGEGATIKLTLQSNECIRFMVNDTDYSNNSGELTVDWQQDAPVAGPLSAADGIIANETIDIAIVGGGISGVYCAWKLQQANPTKKIVLFEGSDHIGGRLLSVSPPDIENMVAELGGMRILPGVQPRIERLVEGPAMLMASYDDGRNVGYWDALRPRRGQAWQAGDEVAAPAVPFVSPNPKKNSDGEWDKYRAQSHNKAQTKAPTSRQVPCAHPDDSNLILPDAGIKSCPHPPFRRRPQSDILDSTLTGNPHQNAQPGTVAQGFWCPTAIRIEHLNHHRRDTHVCTQTP